MYRHAFVFASMALGAACFAALPEHVPGELLVKFVPGSGSAINASIGAVEQNYLPAIGVSKVKLPLGMSVEQGLSYYRSKVGVSYADPNYIARASWVPNDPRFGEQWGPKKIKCVEGWEQMKGSPSVVIAILDTGIDYNHEDLSGKVGAGYDFINDDNDAMDDHGHGTHCAGGAAAKTNNGIGIAGVAPNCSLMPVKVLSAGGGGSYEAVASGILYAADNGANIVSMSLGGGGGTQALHDAVKYAITKNCVVVAAAGNHGTTDPAYPAYYPECIAVANSTPTDERNPGSAYGDWVDVAAPGTQILSTTPGNGYQSWDGTSMACPIVAGQAGLIKSIWPAASNSQVRFQIESTCDAVGSWVVKGRVNVLKSIPTLVTTDPYNLNPVSVAMYEGASFSGGVSTLAASDNLYYRVSSKLYDRLGHVASSKVNFTSVKSPSTFQSLSVKVEQAAATYVTGSVFIWNYTTGKYDLLGSAPLTTADSAKSFTLTKPYTRFFNSSKQAQILVRAVMPISTIRPAVPFSHKIDQVQLNARVPK